MKKIIILFLFISLVFLSLTGCANKDERNIKTDGIRFKEEYENLNNKKNSSGKEYRNISISKENPFIYSTPKEIIEKLENKETFYVYFGSAYCPWCRSVIEKAIEVANENNIDRIYYIDIWNGDHVEILRDVYELNEDGEPQLVSEGATEYSDLLKYFDNVLSDYNLTDENKNSVPVGEKRITAPNFIYVKDGKAIKLETGISSKQTDSRMDFNNEILEDEENKFNDFFQN